MFKIKLDKNKLSNKESKEKSCNIMQTKEQPMVKNVPKFSKKENSIEKIGDVLGTEYYQYFGDFGSTPRSARNTSTSLPNCLLKSYFSGYFYYVKNLDGKDYIWSAKEDGTDIKVISNGSYSYVKQIYTNKHGIYLVFDKKISLLDFNGIEKTCVETSDIIHSYYICDERIYLVTKNSVTNTYIAQWYDTMNERFYNIYNAEDRSINTRNGSWNYGSSINHIMANKKRVIMWLEFWNYNYVGEDGEVYDVDACGWYSFDFDTGKMKCINNNSEMQPHLVLKHPEIFSDYYDIEKSNFWISIAMFDMANDIMWVKTQNDAGVKVWEPRNIDIIPLQKANRAFQNWEITDDMRWQRHYFDGVNRYKADNSLNLFSYDAKGETSSNWYSAHYAGAEYFQICGNYIFFINDSFGREYQFKKEYNPSIAIRESWMSHNSVVCKEQEKAAINKYEGGIKSNCVSLQDIGIKLEDSTNERVKFNKEEYWKEFVEYAFEKSGNREFLEADFPVAAPADRNWYALRLGTAKAHIELSFNTQKNTIRTAVLIKNRELLDVLETLLKKTASVNSVLVNKESKTASISIMKNDVDFDRDRIEQFKWFMEGACIFKKLVISVLS